MPAAPASTLGPPAYPGARRGGARSSVPQKLAEALSSQYGLNVFVAGLLFLLAWAVHAAGMGKRDLLGLLTALMLLQLFWMLWYMGRSYAQRRLIRPKDAHAGARWLRVSWVDTAVLRLLSPSTGYPRSCVRLFSVLEPLLQGLVQVSVTIRDTAPDGPKTYSKNYCFREVYFLWGHAKDIIQSFKTLERFGVIHSVFTNLLLWANSVLNESKHQLNEHKERLITLGFGNITIELDDHSPPCNCSPPRLCAALAQGMYYLYPFTIEYQILASTMLFVLWKNIGRSVDGVSPRRSGLRLRGILAGSALGLGALAATLGVVAVYLVHIGRSKAKSEAALAMFYLYAIALLLLMGAAALLGVGIYRVDEKSLDESKIPARKLDSDLLVGAASGSWLLSWGSILAIACAETRPPYTWYNLPYSVLAIAEKYIQNLFIIESAHREPEGLPEDVCTLRVVTVYNGAAATDSSRCGDSGVAGDTAPQEQLVQPAVKGSLGQQPDLGREEQTEARRGKGVWSSARRTPCFRGSAKRKVLRNITAFLFLCNISLWIPPAFGCRPEYDNGLEEVVFGFEPWIIVVNLAMPFSIFYRMHAAASLFEVYCKI
ncbi:otopetrin-1 [Octodon degus]|uniref:Otopetrin-1 n=1 Tax=Octodon degus TaxID=10160 RepID=A0A6P3EK82_OCTDE|nr:otopetrin-1 [Octodon degus]